MVEDQVILNAAHSGDSLRDKLGDRELPSAESLIEGAQGIERLLDRPCALGGIQGRVDQNAIVGLLIDLRGGEEPAGKKIRANDDVVALAIEERFGAAVRHAGAQAGDVIGKVRVHEATVCAAADLHIRTDSAPLAAQEAQDEILALLGGPLLE